MTQDLTDGGHVHCEQCLPSEMLWPPAGTAMHITLHYRPKTQHGGSSRGGLICLSCQGRR